MDYNFVPALTLVVHLILDIIHLSYILAIFIIRLYSVVGAITIKHSLKIKWYTRNCSGLYFFFLSCPYKFVEDIIFEIAFTVLGTSLKYNSQGCHLNEGIKTCLSFTVETFICEGCSRHRKLLLFKNLSHPGYV